MRTNKAGKDIHPNRPSKIALTVYRMRKSGRSWGEITRRTGISVVDCKKSIEEMRSHVRKGLAEKRKQSIERNKVSHVDWSWLKDIPPLTGSPPRTVWKDVRTYTPEQLEREREAYLQDLMEELSELAK